ncbi:MAG: allantoinase PuuE [Rhodospirillales bacterium]|nr:allantoinase PuuE [Rhodospirillales bacterium]
MTYPRDMIGYGQTPPHPRWPGEARIALQFVVNYEEGAENCILHGDAHSEALNSDNVGVTARQGERDLVTESFYEYGSRAGYWRLMRLFDERGIKTTVFAIGMAIERHPDVGRHAVVGGHEMCCHGWRWIDYRRIPEAEERDHIERAVNAIERASGEKPVGWYTGRVSERTRRLVAADGRFIYDSDAYNDDLPYWLDVGGKPWLVVPYAFDTNDMRFASAPGFNTGSQFFEHLRDTFDFLYREGATSPKMMSVGLHCRLAGRPARAAALERFLDHALAQPGVWICRRDQIARHWMSHHAPAVLAPAG